MPVKGKRNPKDRESDNDGLKGIGSDEDELMSGGTPSRSGKLSEDLNEEDFEEEDLDKELEGFRIADEEEEEEEEPSKLKEDEFEDFFGEEEEKEEDEEEEEEKEDYEEEGIFF